MNLRCRTDVGAAYRSGSQIARVLSEDWCNRELYCPACPSNRLSASRANTPAVDFLCPNCNQPFQLKSGRSWPTKKIADAGYEAMIRAIREDRTPNLLVLQYSREWCIQNLLLIPRMFFSETIIQKRAPLRSSARRAGWIGCNILISRIPEDGKIVVVQNGSVAPKARVREGFSRARRLAQLSPSTRGWTVEVLALLRRLGKSSFSLQDVYAFEGELRAAYPRNQNIRPKIRQQLQVLRDLGLIEFTGSGTYKLSASV